MVNSRAKGIRGELEVAEIIRSYGYEARRSQQHLGAGGAPDILTSLPCHVEVKHREALRIYDALARAGEEAREGKPQLPPLLVHRRNRTQWCATCYLADFLDLLRGNSER